MTKRNHSEEPRPSTRLSRGGLIALQVAAISLAMAVLSGCQGEDAKPDGCSEALEGAASLVVKDASGSSAIAEADLEAHRKNVARAIAPSFLESCHKLSAAKQDTFADCVGSATGLSELRRCEVTSFPDRTERNQAPGRDKEPTDES